MSFNSRRRHRRPSLSDMPEDVMKKILGKSDFRSILTLRKVSHDLRNFIDDVKPELNLDIIQINIADSRLKIFLQSSSEKKSARVQYLKEEDHCKIVSTYRKTSKEWILENEDYLNRFLKDLKIISSHQTSKILESFSLTATEVPDEFQNIFGSPLKTQSFAITTSSQEEILKVLPYMDSEVLQEVCFYNIHEMANEVWDFEKIVELEQWKRAQRLELVYFFVHLPIHHFFHFSYANIRLVEISAADIFQFKQHYLILQNFKYVHVEYKTLTGKPELSNLLGPFFMAEEPQNQDQMKWFFKFPENPEYVLYVLIPDPISVYFSKIEADLVPKGALIQ